MRLVFQGALSKSGPSTNQKLTQLTATPPLWQVLLPFFPLVCRLHPTLIPMKIPEACGKQWMISPLMCKSGEHESKMQYVKDEGCTVHGWKS